MTGFVWTAEEVARALGVPAPAAEPGPEGEGTGTRGHGGTGPRRYAGISTDTRTLGPGDLFVALVGPRFDGHAFLDAVRAAGAAGAVVRRGTSREGLPGLDWFLVDDTLEALGRLAKRRREAFQGPVVAITGTNGKTSTRELVAAALSARFRVHQTPHNYNNLVGTPLTVLSAPLEAQAMVLEVGTSAPGEISRLSHIVDPTVAVITNAGVAHLEGLADLEGVLAEKIQLVWDCNFAVVGTEPPALADRVRNRVADLAMWDEGPGPDVITAGIRPPADWLAEDLRVAPDGTVSFTVRGVTVRLALAGAHQAENAVIALAAADACGVPVHEAAPRLLAARVPSGRSDIFERDGITVINDCYNANPGSLAAALDLLAAVRSGRRTVIVVGTMRELGAASAELHRGAARAVRAVQPDVVAAVGEFVAAFAEAAGGRGRGRGRGGGGTVGTADRVRLITGETPEEVAPALKQVLEPGDVVLLKASRGVELERLIPLLWPVREAG